MEIPISRKLAAGRFNLRSDWPCHTIGQVTDPSHFQVTVGQISQEVTVTAQQEILNTGTDDRGLVFEPGISAELAPRLNVAAVQEFRVIANTHDADPSFNTAVEKDFHSGERTS